MLLLGKPVADKIYKKVRKRLETNNDNKIMIIQVGDNPASNTYIRNKMKKMNELGIEAVLKKYGPKETHAAILLDLVETLEDNTFTGVFLQLPAGSPSLEEAIEKVIIFEGADIDGLKEENAGILYNMTSSQDLDYMLVPCTARGIIQMLEFYNIPIEGKTVGIIGRSNLVGKPLIHMLLSKNATVVSMNSKTENIKSLSRNCDILISAVGKPGFITKEFVNKNMTVIDVGINFVDGHMCGDVDFDEVEPLVKNISPVPRGVGPLTVANLMLNITNTWKGED